MIVQKVHLVDVQEPPVGLGQQAGLEGLDAPGEGALDVDAAANPVLRGAERQVDHGHPHVGLRQGLARVELFRGLRPHQLAVVRGRVEGVVLHDLNLWKDVREGPDGRALPGAAVALSWPPIFRSMT